MTPRLRWLVVVCIYLASGTIRGHAQVGELPPFMLGILRADGNLAPLVHYAAGRWTASWPDDDSRVPTSLAKIPESWWPGFSRRPWRAILESGPLTLTLSTPIVMDVACEKAVGLATTYRGVPPMGNEGLGYERNQAIAIVGDVTTRRVITLDINSPRDQAWRAAEKRLFAVVRAHGRAPNGLRLQFASRISADRGGDIWHFTAVDVQRRVSVWVSDGVADSFEWFDDVTTQPDFEVAGAVIPLAAVASFAQPTMLAWEQGYDGGQFVVITIANNGPVVRVSAGHAGC